MCVLFSETRGTGSQSQGWAPQPFGCSDKWAINASFVKELDDDTTGGAGDISVYKPPAVGKVDFRCAAHCVSQKTRLCVSNTDIPKPPSSPCAKGATICWSRHFQCHLQKHWLHPNTSLNSKEDYSSYYTLLSLQAHRLTPISPWLYHSKRKKWWVQHCVLHISCHRIPFDL